MNNYTNLYFKFKLYSSIIIVGLLVLGILLTILYVIYNIYISNKKHDYLLSIGFKYEFWRTPNDYHYIREINNREVITDREVNKLSYRELKKKYK